MRFIDLEEIEPDIRSMLAPLEEAQGIVNQETDPVKRAEVIKKYRPRWVAFREAFAKYSGGKCWYSESKNPGTDDDIDHFRPKGRLADDDNHGGYYWLAFTWTNFRLSCHHSNRPRIHPESGVRGGKADNFPLVDPRKRAYSELDDLGKEEPLLLDPANIVDVSMLTFNIGGEAVLEPGYAGDPVAAMRLDVSVRCYNLNWPEFRDGRIVLYNRIRRLVSRGSQCAPDRSQMYGSREAFVNTLKDLQRLMSPQSEYSRAARSYIESFSHEWWIREIVLKVA